ncbi:MAG: PD40 domain-containing protein [Nocardioidaceae bacterium]|nr:PD40 domain-containing protein [Nocardioidaceae bacterium]
MTEHAPTRAVRRLTILLLAALATTLLLAAPSEAATSLTASRTAVVGGESVRLSGTLGRQPRRRVLLQRRAGARWVSVTATTSTRRGTFAFTVRPSGRPGTRTLYRARAPRTATRAATTTTARGVVVVAQTAALAVPAQVVTGASFTATATLRPARPGRVTVLQKLTAGTWTEIGRGVQSATGTTVLHPALAALGATSLRVVALASQGAPAFASAARTITVLPPATTRVSISNAGAQADAASSEPGVSADGRYVVFSSDTSTLVADDTNGVTDVFLRDRTAGTTERISLTSDGGQAAELSDDPAISADGRYVVFRSLANLTPGIADSVFDIFLKDRVTGALEKVSVSAPGLLGHDQSYLPTVSADGRYVAFASFAKDLVPGDTNHKSDIFVRDRTAGTTERISVDNDGGEADNTSTQPEISADGQYVAYMSSATNLVAGDDNGLNDVFRWSRANHSSRRVSETSAGVGGDGWSASPSISADGRYVAFFSEAGNLTAGDTDGWADVKVWDGNDGSFEQISLTSTGAEVFADVGSPSISADGRYVAFSSNHAAFTSGDTNGAWDVFVRDRQLGTLRRVSDGLGGAASDGDAYGVLAGDGNTMVLRSAATNLVAGDTNGVADLFARDLTR